MDATTTTTSSPPQPNTAQMEPTPDPQMVVVGRRVPPPCWAPDETTALIQAYRDKWYSLRRGNLRSHDWQAVAEEVASRFPSSPKTSVQCRHKMEKLRKRHRGEKQRAAAFGGVRFKSNWAHFRHMEDMERGPGAPEEEEREEDPDAFLKPLPGFYRNNVAAAAGGGGGENRNMFQTPAPQMLMNGANGYRVRLPERSAPPPRLYDEFGVPRANTRSSFGGSTQVLRNEHGVRGEIGRRVGVDGGRKRASPTEEMVEGIRALGDRFVRAEKMKMDMAREIEEMRMEMEMKRTAMILDSQQQLVEAFADAVFGGVSDKQNKMQTPDC